MKILIYHEAQVIRLNLRRLVGTLIGELVFFFLITGNRAPRFPLGMLFCLWIF